MSRWPSEDEVCSLASYEKLLCSNAGEPIWSCKKSKWHHTSRTRALTTILVWVVLWCNLWRTCVCVIPALFWYLQPNKWCDWTCLSYSGHYSWQVRWNCGGWWWFPGGWWPEDCFVPHPRPSRDSFRWAWGGVRVTGLQKSVELFGRISSDWRLKSKTMNDE